MKTVMTVVGAVLAIVMSTPGSGMASHESGYPAPTGVEASAVGNDVTLTWNVYDTANFPTGCEQGREIRVIRNGTGLDTVAVGVSAYLDSGLAVGVYTYTLQARCNIGPPPAPPDVNNLSLVSTSATVEIADAVCVDAPSVFASANPVLLWPPNGKLVPVAVSGTVTPAAGCGMPGSIEFAVDDEYGVLSGVSGMALVDANTGAFSFQVNLEASRLGADLDGRLYRITVATSDGGHDDGVLIYVPHDQRKR